MPSNGRTGRRGANLATILCQGETETAEFKASFNDEALETIGALANAEGGMLLLGVEPRGVVKRLVRRETSAIWFPPSESRGPSS
jgi:ATP-dependent DNA helicase RecG